MEDDILTHETFALLLNTKFNVEFDDAHVELELHAVSDLKASSHQEQFSIVFRGPSEAFLGQGIRRFDHERMGPFELFVVPIGHDANGYSYESVFNRIRTQDADAQPA